MLVNKCKVLMRIVEPDLLIIRISVRRKGRIRIEENCIVLQLTRGSRRLQIGKRQVREGLPLLSNATSVVRRVIVLMSVIIRS